MEKWGLKFGKMVPKVKPVDLLNSWKIVKGDMVEVISGSYRGKQGKVLRVQRDRNGLIVEGVNLVRIRQGSLLIYSFRSRDTCLLSFQEEIKDQSLQWNNQFQYQMFP